MHSEKTVGLVSVYKQNNILPYLDKVSTNKKHDFFEKGDPELSFWQFRNYRWARRCETVGLTREGALATFAQARGMKVHAGIIVVCSIIQMFINFFLFFVIFLPFAKAYSPCIREKDVYRQNLARLIRNGTHFCQMGAKNFFNAVISVF